MVPGDARHERAAVQWTGGWFAPFQVGDSEEGARGEKDVNKCGHMWLWQR